jgi:hypothetical protein
VSALRLDHDVRMRDTAASGQLHDDRLLEFDARGDADERSLVLLRPGDRADTVLGTEDLTAWGLPDAQTDLLDGRRRTHLDADDVVGAGSSRSRSPRSASGVCFQLTSRPVGTAKSAGSNDVGRSDRVCTGTKPETSVAAGSM